MDIGSEDGWEGIRISMWQSWWEVCGELQPLSY